MANGVRIAPGAYNFQDVETTYYLGPQRLLSGRINLNYGSFYDGQRTVFGLSSRLNLGARLGVEPRASVNWVDLPGDRFTTQLLGGRVTFTMTPRLGLASLIQYNFSVRSVTSNVRFRWEYIPGRDLFVVYTDGRDTSRPGFPTLDSQSVVIKATRLLRR